MAVNIGVARHAGNSYIWMQSKILFLCTGRYPLGDRSGIDTWYNRRVDACKDKQLRAVLAHNRDAEKEHAAMVLEQIRRRDPAFDRGLRDFLFTDKPVAHE
jgi:hypothetical protein